MASVASSCSQTSGRTMNEDGGQLCRICHEACHLAKDIYMHQDPGVLICEIIYDICRLRIFPGDGLSRYVCTNCHQSVLQLYRFKRSVQEGQAALKSIHQFGEPNCSGARHRESGDALAANDCATSRERRRSTNSLCRLCVNVSRFYRNIFMQKHHGIYFYKIINELCSINVAVGDNFPAWVCQVCHTSVIEFFKFKRLAHYKNSSALPRMSANPSPGFLTGLRLRSEDSLLERRAGLIGNSRPGEPQTQTPRANDSTAEADGTVLSDGNTGGEDTCTHDSSADDADDLDDYLEWLEYREFTDFIDSFPFRGSGDDGCFEASILHDMRGAPSVGGSGAAQRAKELRELLEQRRKVMKASRVGHQRLHELRMMRMQAKISLKEQKVRHMREMMSVRKKIMESKEEIEKMKAKSQKLNKWRASIEKKDGTSSVNEEDSPQTATQGMDMVDELPGNIVVKEEPRDFIDIDEFPFKEEPGDGSVHDEDTVATVNEDEAITADTSGNEQDKKTSRKRQQEGVEVEEVVERRQKVGRWSDYSTETLRLAVEAVASKHWSIWKAADHYNIPWVMLRDYVKISQESGYISSLPSSGTTAGLSLSPGNEDKLVKFFTEMKLRGFGMCPKRVRQMAYALALEEQNDQPHEHDVAQHYPSNSWLEDFCSRHSLNLGTLTDPTMQPSYHADSTVLTTFYDKIRLLYDQLGIMISPNQVWNCDETSLSCVSSDGSIGTRVGRRYACEISAECNGELQVSTILTCGSASGDVGPAMVVFKGGEDSSLSCQDVLIASTKTGCLDHGTFEEWFNKFTQEVQVDRPLFLLLDSQNNHLSPQVIDAAVESGVILLPVDFLTSGSLQPVEVSIMHPLHDLWRQYLEQFQQGNVALVPRYQDFLSWFPSAFHAVAVKDGIIAGFCKTGIYPPHRLVLKHATASRAGQGEQECVPLVKFDFPPPVLKSEAYQTSQRRPSVLLLRCLRGKYIHKRISNGEAAPRHIPRDKLRTGSPGRADQGRYRGAPERMRGP